MATRRPDSSEADDVPTAPVRDGEPTSGLQPQVDGLDFDDETVIESGAGDYGPVDLSAAHPLSPDYPALDYYGRYEILGRLAVGGMAEVFLAREVGKHGAARHVAVKRILPQIADDDTFVEMFLDEARLAMRLNHPNICHIYDIGELEETYFIAMEWVNGVPLGRLISKAREAGTGLPIPVAVKVMAQVSDALNYAHQARDGVGRPLNIVHRDVSPQNVMVRFDGVIKLLDFGIAKAATQTSQTEAGIVKGKFSYMSPEQCLGKPLDARSDIFAIGACLYEALTGKPAFRRASDLDTMRAIVHEPVPSARIARDDVPPRLDAIVRKALAKDPAQRFQTAGELYVALERFLAEQGEFIHAMHITQFIDKVLPNAQGENPLTPGSSPSGRALKLGSGSRPKSSGQPPAAEASVPTIDKHQSAQQPAPAAPVDVAVAPVDIELEPLMEEEELPTEQWSGEEMPSVVRRAQAEALARKNAEELDDGSTTDVEDLVPNQGVPPIFTDPTAPIAAKKAAEPSAFDSPATWEVPPQEDKPSMLLRVGVVLLALLAAAGVTVAILWATEDGPTGPGIASPPGELEATETAGSSASEVASAEGAEAEGSAPTTVEEPPPVAPEVGAVTVETDPPGAEVTFGEQTGTSPVTFEDVEVGTHAVSVELDGYEAAEDEVEILAGETAEVELELVANEPEPGADGADEAESPSRGARRATSSRRASPRRAATATRTVSLDSSPRGARVYHGRRFVGTTPLEAALPVGTIRLRLVTPDGRSVLRSVRVRESGPARAFLPLGGG